MLSKAETLSEFAAICAIVAVQILALHVRCHSALGLIPSTGDHEIFLHSLPVRNTFAMLCNAGQHRYLVNSWKVLGRMLQYKLCSLHLLKNAEDG